MAVKTVSHREEVFPRYAICQPLHIGVGGLIMGDSPDASGNLLLEVAVPVSAHKHVAEEINGFRDHGGRSLGISCKVGLD